MKVLYVLERWPELSQTFVAEEIRALTVLGCDIDVLAFARGRYIGDQQASAARASYFADAGAAERLRATIGQILADPGQSLQQLRDQDWPPPDGSRSLRGLARLAPFRPLAAAADLIHAHFATEAADAARLLSAATGTPWSFTAHGADAYGDQAALRTRLSTAAFARAGSAHVAERLRAAAPDARIVEIPVAVATSRFASAGTCNADGPIVSVGRLVEKKGFTDLIKAFRSAELGERRLTIIGDGPLRGELERDAAGLNVEFRGALSPAEVAETLGGASLFALLSKVAADGDRDGLPAAIVEAMAAGLPVLSTRIAGIEEIVHPDSGVLIEPSDPEGAAAALRHLLGLGPGAREAMGASGIARAAPFAPPEVGRRLLAEFNFAV